MTDNKQKPAAKPKLHIVKNEDSNNAQNKGLEPKSEIGKSMNDFCNQLQKQIDAIMKM
jgi:hypothetical protein